MELDGSSSFVGMKLVLVIIKVKHRIMTSYIQYEIQYKYNIQYKFKPKRCQGAGMPVFYHFNLIHHLDGEKSFQNHNFSKLAMYLTALITPSIVIDTKALVSCGN